MPASAIWLATHRNGGSRCMSFQSEGVPASSLSTNEPSTNATCCTSPAGHSATRSASRRRAALTSASFSKNEPLATIRMLPLADHDFVDHQRLAVAGEQDGRGRRP